MNHLLFQWASKWLFRFFMVVGIFFLIRGHNEPGGGFIAGLIVAAGFIIRYLAKAQQTDPKEYRLGIGFSYQWVVSGLTLALLSSLLSWIQGGDFMTSQWHFELWLPIFGFTKFGTPFYFDIGVFLVVVGVVTQIFLKMEEAAWRE